MSGTLSAIWWAASFWEQIPCIAEKMSTTYSERRLEEEVAWSQDQRGVARLPTLELHGGARSRPISCARRPFAAGHTRPEVDVGVDRASREKSIAVGCAWSRGGHLLPSASALSKLVVFAMGAAFWEGDAEVLRFLGRDQCRDC